MEARLEGKNTLPSLTSPTAGKHGPRPRGMTERSTPTPPSPLMIFLAVVNQRLFPCLQGLKTGGKERPEVPQNFPIRTGGTAFLFLQHFIHLLSTDFSIFRCLKVWKNSKTNPLVPEPNF